MENLTPAYVYRRYNIDGVQASGLNKPDQAAIIRMLNLLFGVSRGGWVVAETVAELNAVTPENETDGGVVLTGTGAGYYDRSGGAWVFGRGFPDTFARVALSGTGTAQTGTVGSGVVPANIEVFFAVVATPNTGPLDLSISGDPLRDVVNVAGNELSEGEWTGVVMFFLNDDGKYQLINDAGAAAAAAQSATDAETAQTAAEMAETGAEAARDQAVAAASSVTSPKATLALLEADTPDSDPEYYDVAYYDTNYVTGSGAKYRKVASEPGHIGKAQNGNGTWYEIASNFRTPEMYGAKGDDTENDGTGTDDLNALRAALASGVPVYARPGAAYRASDKVDMEDGTKLNLLGARINFYGDGKRCLSPKNNCVVEGGAVYNYGDTTGLSGDLQCPIAIGIFSGTGAGTGYHNVRVSNVEIGSAWVDGNGIIITGDSQNIVVENIRAPEGGFHVGILVHWAGDTVSGTVHPHNIDIRNVDIGELPATSRFSSYGLLLSGGYNITVDNVDIETCGCSVQVYVGDYGETYTPDDELGLVNRGIVISNAVAKECWSGPWVNGEAGVSGGQFETDVKLVNCGAKCSVTSGTTTSTFGMQFTGANGAEVNGGEFSGFYVGVSFGGASETNRHLKINGAMLRDMYLSGIFGSLSVRPPEDIEIVGCRILDCNTGEATTALGSAIYVGGKRMTVQDNFISSEKSTNGVYVLSTATGSVVEHNYVDALVSGGVAYNINAATKGGGNSAASGITLHSGVPITDCLFGAATVDLASVAAGASVSQTVTVTGAALGDFVEAISSTTDLSGLSVTGEISAADTVRLWFYNNNDSTAVDLGSAAFTVLVRKRA